MIRQLKYRCVGQNNDLQKHKYPLTVIQASTTEQYPFQVQTADIEVVSNSKKGTSGYTTPIRSDDFVRLQVSSQLKPSKFTIWQDLFVGQIQSASSSYGSKNTLNIHGVGFLDEVNWTAIKETKEWATTTDAQAIFQYLLKDTNGGLGYRRRLTFDSNYCLSGATVPAFSVSQNQTYMTESITSMEEQSGYTYRASAIPIFDTDNNVDTIYFGWKPLPSVVTSKYAVIEGSSRVISSEFASSIEELRNREIVIGSSTGSIAGSSTDSASILQYGERTRVDTLNWITTNNQANNKASNVVGYSKLQSIYGNATLILTPQAHPGDLVYCKSPSQELDGGIVDCYLPVYRVRHDIPSNTTTLDLGRINKDAYDYIGQINRDVVNIKNNIAKVG